MRLRGRIRKARLGETQSEDSRVVPPILDDGGNAIGTADLDLESYRHGPTASLVNPNPPQAISFLK